MPENPENERKSEKTGENEGKIYRKGRNGGKLKLQKPGEPSLNPNGRPKGKSKKTQLKKLIKDVSELWKELEGREKILAYQIYEISISDFLNPENINSTIEHLYFIESEIGIKIGKSKNVNSRLEQIKNYMPSARIIKVIQFAGAFEKKIHKHFKHINIEGNKEIGIEWFYKKQELMEFISENDSVNDLSRIYGSKESGQMLLFK